jgi:THO complex subunit 2
MLFPSLTLLQCNPAAVNELWSVLNLFEWEIRYRIYGQMVDELYESSPILLYARERARKDTRDTTKRISKDNVKDMGRVLSKFAHSNSLVVLELVCSQLESYDNLIDPLIERCVVISLAFIILITNIILPHCLSLTWLLYLYSFRSMTQLSFDVLAYVIVRRLAVDRETLNESGDLSKWIQSIAKFVGRLYRKHPYVELGGLLQFIVNRIKDKQSHILHILNELMKYMGGAKAFDGDQLDDGQLYSLSGGSSLQTAMLGDIMDGLVR